MQMLRIVIIPAVAPLGPGWLINELDDPNSSDAIRPERIPDIVKA